MTEQNLELLTIGELAAQLKVKPSWINGETGKNGPGTIQRYKMEKYLRF